MTSRAVSITADSGIASPCGNWIDAEPFWLVYGTRGSKNNWCRQMIESFAIGPSRVTMARASWFVPGLSMMSVSSMPT